MPYLFRFVIKDIKENLSNLDLFKIQNYLFYLVLTEKFPKKNNRIKENLLYSDEELEKINEEDMK